MGAWGSGSFENDAALDWAATVRSLADVRGPFERLAAVTEAGDPIDADIASEAIAAAETVAMLLGRTITGFPGDLRERLRDAGAPDDRLVEQAREAIFPVLRDSELALLWAEAAAESGVNEWQQAITGLVDRLNPALPFEPWEEAEIAQAVGGPVGPCAFCGGPVAREELWGMNIRDYSDRMSIDQGLWFHLPCLNGRLHHGSAIVDMKFDPEKLPDVGGV